MYYISDGEWCPPPHLYGATADDAVYGGHLPLGWRVAQCPALLPGWRCAVYGFTGSGWRSAARDHPQTETVTVLIAGSIWTRRPWAQIPRRGRH